jgi:hypothetical protein
MFYQLRQGLGEHRCDYHADDDLNLMAAGISALLFIHQVAIPFFELLWFM